MTVTNNGKVFTVHMAQLPEPLPPTGWYSVEASDLELRPGDWPLLIAARDPGGRIYMFGRTTRLQSTTGRFLGYNYTDCRVGIRVFND